jgi:hypothetical protein
MVPYLRSAIIISSLIASGAVSAAYSPRWSYGDVRKADRLEWRSGAPIAISRDTLPLPPNTPTTSVRLALYPLELADTVTPEYAIRFDTVLTVTGYRVASKRCGVGHWFFRLRVKRTGTVVHADSVVLPVCQSQWPVAGGDTSKADAPAPLSCATLAIPPPSCVDTAASILGWRTTPCAWKQNSPTTIACYPFGPADTTKNPPTLIH